MVLHRSSKLYRAAIVAALGFSSLNQSCTGSDDSSAAAPYTVSGDGAAATFAPGVLAVGVTATVKKVDVPSEFAALTEAPDASVAIEVKGVKDDKAITEALSSPFTLQIDLSVVPVAALAEQAKTEVNLCVVAKSSGEVLFVWRKGNLTYANSKVSFESKNFGVFQIRYCGALDLEAYTEVKKETTTTPDTTTETSTSALGSTVPVPVCDMSAANGLCVEYPSSFGTGQVATSVEAACKQGSGTFTVSSTCKTTGLVGNCTITQTGSGFEVISKYFYYSPLTAETGLDNCTEDKADSPAKDGETKVWVFTKADGTKTTLP